MADTHLRAWPATDQLQDDHRRIWKLLKWYEDLEFADTDSKLDLLRQIRRELLIHIELEETVFYPSLDGLGLEWMQELTTEAHEEHEIVKLLLEQLSRMDPADPYFDAKVKVLSDNVRIHANGEEREIFALFRMLERTEQDHIAEELRRRREVLAGER